VCGGGGEGCELANTLILMLMLMLMLM